MQIQLQNISKRYGFEWIFKNVTFDFEAKNKYAIVGPNGSGKSTLLKIISNGLVPTSGNISYSVENKIIKDEHKIAQEIAYAAPYISLTEDYTLQELYEFHTSFKKLKVENIDAFYEVSQLGKHKHKYVKNFSSGMKQRLKLSLAFLSETKVLLLDEPTSNFDTKAIDWYFGLIEKYTQDRLLIIGSNQAYEYDCCPTKLDVMGYK
ncbi:MAG: ABC transporter ATP-binding protein [Chitinophagales bacterium]|nr:ABC transporter ATP-binding protein [Bacteroidota bacterium]